MDVPTLSTTGSQQSPKLKMAKLFEYFLISDYGQSFIYAGNVTSLRYIISKNPSDVDTIKENIKEALIKMYNRYFDATEVTVNSKVIDGITKLVIEVDSEYGGGKVSLRESLTVSDIKETFDGTYYNELDKHIKY